MLISRDWVLTHFRHSLIAMVPHHAFFATDPDSGKATTKLGTADSSSCGVDLPGIWDLLCQSGTGSRRPPRRTSPPIRSPPERQHAPPARGPSCAGSPLRGI